MFGLLSLPSFLLSLQTSTTCPTTWIVSDNFCYKISTEPMDWGRAQQYCWAEGGYLAELTSAEEESLTEQFLPEGLTYWLGLSDFAQEGIWTWQESHEISGYFNWAPGQPSGSEGEDCVWKSYDTYGWHDADCFDTQYHGQVHALCQAAKGTE